MRKLLLLTLLASVALAGGINIDTATRFEFTDCASGGSASQAITEGTYLMRVTDADVFLCWAGTCAAAGEKFPSGTVVMLSFGRGNTTLSCRSSASTGDIILTRANSN